MAEWEYLEKPIRTQSLFLWLVAQKWSILPFKPAKQLMTVNLHLLKNSFSLNSKIFQRLKQTGFFLFQLNVQKQIKVKFTF